MLFLAIIYQQVLRIRRLLILISINNLSAVTKASAKNSCHRKKAEIVTEISDKFWEKKCAENMTRGRRVWLAPFSCGL